MRFYGTWVDETTGEVVENGRVHVEGNGGDAFAMDVTYEDIDTVGQTSGVVQWYPQENVPFTPGSQFVLGLCTYGDGGFDALSVPSQEINDKTVGEYQRILGEPRTATGAAVLVWAEFSCSNETATTGSTMQGSDRAP